MNKIDAHPFANSKFGGLFLAVAPALFYATTVNVVPTAYAYGASAVLVLALRFSTNIVIANAVALSNRKPASAIMRSERLALFIVSVSLIGQTYGMMKSLEVLPVSIAITIFFTFPIISYFIERMQKRARPHFIAVLALLTSLLGVWLMTKSTDTSWDISAIWWPIISAILQATIQSAAESVRSVHGWRMVKITSVLPAVVFIALAVNEANGVSFEAVFWAFIVATGFCLAMYFLFLSVRVNGALRSANMLYLEPVIAVPISILVYNDSLSISQWAGICLIAFGCGVIEWRERKALNQPQPV